MIAIKNNEGNTTWSHLTFYASKLEKYDLRANKRHSTLEHLIISIHLSPLGMLSQEIRI